MPSFGERSRRELDTCHPDLQRLAAAVIKHYDFSVIEGTRTQARQAQLFAEGRSDFDGVTKKSNHQTVPSMAMDLLPYPAKLHGKNIWEDTLRFAHFIGIVKGVASGLGIEIRCGFDWNSDGSPHDHDLVDYPHVELVR